MSLHRVKTALAFLLVLTLTLPAYTCDGYRAPSGELVDAIPAGADSSAYVAAEVPHRPLKQFDATEARQWLTLLAYSWALLLVAVETWRPRTRRTRTATGLWLLLPLASAAWIQWHVIVGDIAYGGVLTLAVLAVLWVLSLWELRVSN